MPTCNTTPAKCIGVIDPHSVTRHGIRHLLGNGKWSLSWETETSHDAQVFMESRGADILLYEPVFEMSRAPSFVKALRGSHPQLVIILHTMVTENSWLREAMNMGARALVSKRGNLGELTAALELAMQGQAFVSADLLTMMYGESAGGKINPARLTSREREIFKMVGLGQKASDIARSLGISPRTVDAHKQHIKDKLQLDGNSNLASAATTWLQSQWAERDRDPK